MPRPLRAAPFLAAAAALVLGAWSAPGPRVQARRLALLEAPEGVDAPAFLERPSPEGGPQTWLLVRQGEALRALPLGSEPLAQEAGPPPEDVPAVLAGAAARPGRMPPPGETWDAPECGESWLLQDSTEEPLGWSPSWARGPDGGLHLAFDRLEADGRYAVVHRDPAGRETVLPRGAVHAFHPSLAAAPDGRLWLAWDEAPEDWGRRNELHRERRLALATRAPEGGPWVRVQAPEPALPEAAGFEERPRLGVDARGRLWLFTRLFWEDLAWRVRSQLPLTGWTGRLRVLTAEGWTRPQALPDSSGGGVATVALLPRPGGEVLAAWSTDGRGERVQEMLPWETCVLKRPRVLLFRLELEAPGPAQPPEPEAAPPRPALLPPPARDPDPALVPPGHVRLWGDLHRHTDLSRCAASRDGTLSDQYRYAWDLAGLDFVAITDHYQHLNRAAWAAEMRALGRFHRPGRRLALPAFEQTHPSLGHRNLFSADPEAARDAPFALGPPEDPLRAFDGEDWMAIPHQLAHAGSLYRWPPEAAVPHPVVELYQGNRGSFEAPGAPLHSFQADPAAPHALDWLREGRRFGFVAASDHVANGRAFTAALVRERSREGVLEALRARRTYAASAPMALDLRLGALLPGQRGSVPGNAAAVLRFDAGAPLARVVWIRNGRVVQVDAGPPSDPELLMVRVGEARRSRNLRLEVTDGILGEPLPFAFEDGDHLRLAEAERVAFHTELGSRDQDGLVIPARLPEGARLRVTSRGESREVEPAALRREPARFLLKYLTVELRLDPPALGLERGELRYRPPADDPWRAGDWLYLRLVRLDGEVAWTSPVWIDASGEGG